jgi:hypothetical protein
MNIWPDGVNIVFGESPLDYARGSGSGTADRLSTTLEALAFGSRSGSHTADRLSTTLEALARVPQIERSRDQGAGQTR